MDSGVIMPMIGAGPYTQYDLRANRVQWSLEVEAIHGLAPGSFDGKVETILRLLGIPFTQPTAISAPDSANARSSSRRSVSFRLGRLARVLLGCFRIAYTTKGRTGCPHTAQPKSTLFQHAFNLDDVKLWSPSMSPKRSSWLTERM